MLRRAADRVQVAEVGGDTGVTGNQTPEGAAKAVDVDVDPDAAQLAAVLTALERRRGAPLDDTLAEVAGVRRQARGNRALLMRAQLIEGDVLDRQGDVAGGAKLVWEVHQWATQHREPALLARSHYLLASAYRNLGDNAACLEHALRAVELLDDETPAWVRTVHLVKLGDAFSHIGSYDAARERYRAAEQDLLASGDVAGLVAMLNNLAYTEHEAGQPERAWSVVERMLGLADAHGVRMSPNTLDTVARVHIDMGRYAEAEEIICEVVRDLDASRFAEADTLATYLLTLAEIKRLKGELDAAQSNLDESRAICEERGLAELSARVHEQQAEVHAARGEFEQAYSCYRSFHTETERLRSKAREAAIRTRQALFETAEARAAADRFREQARRDPLTGLRNRRFVDEQLPLLLQGTRETGVPLSIALVDLDLFKVVNDRYSHDTGDQVLVAVSALLTQLVGGPDAPAAEFVARMGGEEFLIVLPGADLAAAVTRMQRVRHAVRDYHWAPLIEDLVQTVSVGVATAEADSSQVSLLRRADAHLYAAKRRGRDRVCSDSAGEGEKFAARRHNRDVTVPPAVPEQ